MVIDLLDLYNQIQFHLEVDHSTLFLMLSLLKPVFFPKEKKQK